MSKDQKPTSFCVQQKEIFSIRPCQTGIAAATRMKKTQTKTKKNLLGAEEKEFFTRRPLWTIKDAPN